MNTGLLGKIGIGLAAAGLTAWATYSISSYTRKDAKEPKPSKIYYSKDEKFLAVDYDDDKTIETYLRKNGELVKRSTIKAEYLEDKDTEYKNRLEEIKNDFQGLRKKLEETSPSKNYAVKEKPSSKKAPIKKSQTKKTIAKKPAPKKS